MTVSSVLAYIVNIVDDVLDFIEDPANLEVIESTAERLESSQDEVYRARQAFARAWDAVLAYGGNGEAP